MLSINLSKFIKSLQLKKYRKLHSSFFVEGKVNILELINSEYKITHLFLSKSAVEELNIKNDDKINFNIVSQKELDSIGTYKNNTFGIAVAKFIKKEKFVLSPNEWVIALDDINDPGNLGTIIRTEVYYEDLKSILDGIPVITAEMKGENLYDFNWPSGGVLLMGNESHGVKKELSKLASDTITIPRIGEAESLNVAIATSIICSHLKKS